MTGKRSVSRLAEGVTLLKQDGLECCIWLVEGTDSALLIDTGLGADDLRSEVEALTKLPYKVVNTHGHGDHCGGNYQFERVYMHEKALPLSKEALEMTRIVASPEKIEDIRQQMIRTPVEVVFVAEGDTFDLGGRQLEVIETPGHTPGDITLADREHGLLFSGDCMVRSMEVLLIVPQAVSVACYAESMHKLTAIENIRGFCSGHDTCIMPRSFLQDCADCADEILAGCADCQKVEVDYPDVERTCMLARHGDAAILYRNSIIH